MSLESLMVVPSAVVGVMMEAMYSDAERLWLLERAYKASQASGVRYT